MTFKEYLARRQIRDNPAGDFTKDARSDIRMPDVESWKELRSYLEGRVSWGMRNAVIEAARTVWLGYQAKLKKERSL